MVTANLKRTIVVRYIYIYMGICGNNLHGIYDVIIYVYTGMMINPFSLLLTPLNNKDYPRLFFGKFQIGQFDF